ncbi:TonB-dependent receptor plug domain-containing protein [Nitrospina watsonii]|uniref:TonB-dependent receptor n=1 Tax=Nitrospina watsonii TaxID=1323948 RepID=A0ABN8VZ75_9BACT|nr:TonB-dependent receptor [Nitrospina watsonii]CAI2717219.1 TonB-dependent receptor [Nitrospina watsonii]
MTDRIIRLVWLPILLVAGILAQALPLQAEPGDATALPAPRFTGQLDSLMEVPLEELFQITVTSPAKKEQPLYKAASAIYVITGDDLRRTGATSVQEALRLVPGMMVAQIDSASWAISARGFNNRFANKLQVMIDGRSLYTPLFAGVFWDEVDLIMEDIERVEVIRGPGAALWGVNAVNGVINIITKTAHRTQGSQVSVGGGTMVQNIDSFRYGTQVNPETSYRVWGKYVQRAPLDTMQGMDGVDDYRVGRGGFRLDWDRTPADTFTFAGNYYDGALERRSLNGFVSFTPPQGGVLRDNWKIDGGMFLARWKHRLNADSDFSLQFYYNRQHRRTFQVEDVTIDTYDLDFQHRFRMTPGQELTWGIGQRFYDDSFENTLGFQFDPDRRLSYITSAFVQDEIRLVPDRWTLTVGSKFSFNNYTGFEYQPSARLLWTPNPKHTVWGAVSRAVRIPSRADDSLRVNQPPPAGPATLALIGQNGFESEDLLAFELGYRVQPQPSLWIDIATFMNFYENLRTLEQGAAFVEPTPAPAHAVVPFLFRNRKSGYTYGVETALNWSPLDWWRFKTAFTWFDMNLKLEPGSRDAVLSQEEHVDPAYQFNLRSHIDLPHKFEFDQMLYYVDSISSNGMKMKGYTRVDLRLGWRPMQSLELSVVGRNLLDPHHLEFATGTAQTTDLSLIERSVFGQVIWRY